MSQEQLWDGLQRSRHDSDTVDRGGLTQWCSRWMGPLNATSQTSKDSSVGLLGLVCQIRETQAPSTSHPQATHSYPRYPRNVYFILFFFWFMIWCTKSQVRVSNKSADTKVSWTNCCSSCKTCCLRYLTKDAERSLLHATSLWTVVYPPKRKDWSKLGSRLGVGFLVAPENGTGELLYFPSCKVKLLHVQLTSAKPFWERSGATFTASSARGWDDCSCQ